MEVCAHVRLSGYGVRQYLHIVKGRAWLMRLVCASSLQLSRGAACQEIPNAS